MRKLTIALDVDDVVMPCGTFVIQELNRKYGLNLDVNNVTTYDFSTFSKLEQALVFEAFRNPELFKSQRPAPGAVEMVDTLVDWGHDVIFASAVSGQIMTTRAESLCLYFDRVPEKNIMLGTRKDLLRTDILYDDNMEHIVSSQAINPIIRDQPWNINDSRRAVFMSAASNEEFLKHVWDISGTLPDTIRFS